jgi:hypothetical protein
MPSIITSIIGGIQGSSAAHNAANSLSGAYNSAGQTVTNAAAAVNPTITNAAAAGANQVLAAGQTGVTGLSPYTTAGSTAANALATDLLPGGQLNTPFTAATMATMSPGYQFQLQQGTSAMNRQAAAAGLSGSGGTMKALDQYNQNFAGTAYNNAFNQYTAQNQNLFANLNSQAQQGQAASTTAANLGVGTAEYGAGMNYAAANTTAQNTLSAANYLANTQIGAGNAQAQGDTGAANQWNGMLGGIGTAGNNMLALGMPYTGSPTQNWSFANMGFGPPQ